MPIITIEVVYKQLPFILTSEEEKMLEEVAEEYEDFRIDGIQVRYIEPDTIKEYISENRLKPAQRVVLELLDKKLKANLGEDFDAFDFIIEQK